MSNKKVVSFYKFREMLFSLLSECKNDKINEVREKILVSDVCKLCCFEETVENGILTAQERETLENLNGQEIGKLLSSFIVLDESTTFDRPRFVHLSSGLSLQACTVKIPTAITQMKIRMLRLYLEPVPHKSSYRHSFGHGSKKRLDLMEQEIDAVISSFPYGFKVKLMVSHSRHYLKTLKEYIPIPDTIIENLVKSGNLTVRQLFPETAGLNVIPFVEEIFLPFWFTRFIQQVTRKSCKILHYRDSLLVLCRSKEEIEKAIDRFRDIMPSFGLSFDYNTLELIEAENSFSFLGKTYKLEKEKSVCEPEQKLFNCFLNYAYCLTKSPVIPLTEVADQLNIIILCLNLYYRGVSEKLCEEFLDSLTVGLYERYGNKSIGEIQSILFETDVKGKKYFKSTAFDEIKLDELFSIDDFNNDVTVKNLLTGTDDICPLCNRKIDKREEVVRLKSEIKSWNVHLRCNDNVYEILKNLESYSGIFPFEKERWREVLNKSESSSERKLPLIDSSWIYYPLYEFFLSQKEKLVRLSFTKMEKILGTKIHKQQKIYENIVATPDGNNLELIDAWEKAGYRIKPMRNSERFNGSLTFERIEPSDCDLINHPIMKTEASVQVQKDLIELVQTLINSRK